MLGFGGYRQLHGYTPLCTKLVNQAIHLEVFQFSKIFFLILWKIYIQGAKIRYGYPDLLTY